MSVYADYKSFGSYTPGYIEAKKKLMEERDRVTYFVLEGLMFHANEYGLCYPGVRKLADLCGYSETNVRRALKKLFEMGYVRGHYLPDELGKKKFRYQISPWVIHIRPEYIQGVMDLWNRATVICYERNNAQPASTSFTPAKPAEPAKPVEPEISSKEKEILSSSSSNNANDDEFNEQEIDLMVKVIEDFGVTGNVADELFRKYPLVTVNGVYHHVKHQIKRGLPVRNPAGLMISLLRKEPQRSL